MSNRPELLPSCPLTGGRNAPATLLGVLTKADFPDGLPGPGAQPLDLLRLLDIHDVDGEVRAGLCRLRRIASQPQLSGLTTEKVIANLGKTVDSARQSFAATV